MRRILGTLLVGLIAALPTQASASSENWHADFDEALAIARKEKKDLFIDFTGSDWCGWCKKLDKEVFGHEEFLKPIQESFVLVALDFPRAQELKDAVPNPERNRELATQFGVQGYPTILLVNTDLEVFGRTGYQEGGPDKYMEHVNELSTDGKQALKDVNALVKAYDKAEGPAREKALEALIAAFAEMSPDSVGVMTVGKKLKGYLREADVPQERTLQIIKALVSTGQADDGVFDLIKQRDPKNEHGLYELLVMNQVQAVSNQEECEAAVIAILALDKLGPIKDKELALEIYLNGAFFAYNYLLEVDEKYKQISKDLATKALAFVADDDTRRKEFLDMILNAE